ncbi:hypothetical protein DQQ10_25900 [Pseudochryseolinea flava]|uniref:Uncharacterized protein n=2 Tax=Pseudochryseolinea flava TaxID=2059302 RepID=A0A364XVS3_9BACT|nr:hypothetical protein DQQ10_25900 [Pseudochryseolinea flava]
MVFHLVGHLVGHFTWKDTDDSVLRDVIQKMDTHHFDFMGTSQTLGGHHEGYSVMLGLTLIVMIIITWIASLQITNNSAVKSMVLIIGVFFLGYGVVEAIYFFPLPAATSILAGIFMIVGGMKRN